MSTRSAMKALVERLAYLGLVPYVFFAVLLWLVGRDLHPFVAIALSGYGAVIASFLGGIQWGVGLLALDRGKPTDALPPRWPWVWGLALPLIAWLCVMMPAYAGLPLLGLVSIGGYLVDRKTWPTTGLRDWMTWRFRLAVVSFIACMFGAAAT